MQPPTKNKVTPNTKPVPSRLVRHNVGSRTLVSQGRGGRGGQVCGSL